MMDTVLNLVGRWWRPGCHSPPLLCGYCPRLANCNERPNRQVQHSLTRAELASSLHRRSQHASNAPTEPQGMTDAVADGLARKHNERFAMDTHRCGLTAEACKDWACLFAGCDVLSRPGAARGLLEDAQRMRSAGSKAGQQGRLCSLGLGAAHHSPWLQYLPTRAW